jgi:S-DNA-T family DNA segregation ATPase FtsK/SpoIIIE
VIFRASVQDVWAAAAYDIEVSASNDSTVGSLLAALPQPVNEARCFVGIHRLDPHATVTASPLLSGSTITIGGPGPAVRVATAECVGVLEVISGPDAGFAVTLPAGAYPLARNARAAVPLHDSDVSRHSHAELDIAPDGQAVVTDRGSTNGTFIDGEPVTGSAVLALDAILQIGADELRWTPMTAASLRTTRGSEAKLHFDRAFAAAPPLSTVDITLPAQPSAGTRSTAIPVVLSAIGGLVLFSLVRSGISLLVGVGLTLATFGATRVLEHRQRAERERIYREALLAVADKLDVHIDQEQRIRHQLAPGMTEITAAALGTRADLWTRRAGSANSLVLRVGVADLPASATMRGEPPADFPLPQLDSVPITVNLARTGVLGVVGPDDETADVVRWLLIQLATLRGPDDLRIVVITPTENTWLNFVRWLPHIDAGVNAPMPCWIGNTAGTRTTRVGELRHLVAARRSVRSRVPDETYGSDIVVVLDRALSLRDMPGLDEILRDGPSVGVYFLCVDQHGMNECRGLCEIDGESVRVTTPDGTFVANADRMDAPTAQRLARALSPMRDRLTLAAVQHALPSAVRLVDVLGMRAPSVDEVRRLWDLRAGPWVDVVLGADARGPVRVDLDRDGPHTMLGGATGAGKSVLLQTLVTSLLLVNRPTELNLVLVDFKGGSAFLPFERCPHVVAMIRSTGQSATDVFDSAAAARMITSTRAEVSRRESWLAPYGGEIDNYWARRITEPQLPPLPRLVMVFDEFGRVLDAFPDLIREMVNVAAKGRSLGMHLVLATQSLQGKLSPELRNNISLRISLRQNESADSVEVLGVPDAATIPGDLYGRGMILRTKSADRTPELFQAGYLGDPPPTGESVVTVRMLEWADIGAARPTRQADLIGQTDQDLVIAAVIQAAKDIGLAAPFRPLLPALPVALPLDDLANYQTAPSPTTAAPFGLCDLPEAQAQPAEVLDLRGTSRLLVAGGPQSGRTTFARTLITSLRDRFGPDQAHLYVIERRPAGLTEYASLAICGGVMSSTEPDRIRRLVIWLEREVQRRALAENPRVEQPSPAIILIIDGWEYFETYSEPALVESALLVKLRGIISAGAPLGIHVVPLGGPEMLTRRLPDLYGRRLLLPFPKEETRRMHLTGAMVSPAPIPGRAIDAATGRHIQICTPSRPDAAAAVQPDAATTVRPVQFPALPTNVLLHDLPSRADRWIALGIGGDDLTPIGIDPLGAGPHQILISGPPGSGRTTAAATIARGLRRVGLDVLVVASPRSPLAALLPDDPGLRVVTGVAIKDVDLRDAAASFEDRPWGLVVDDLDQVTVIPTEQGFRSADTLLDECSQPAARGRRVLVVTANATPMLASFPSAQARLITTINSIGHRIVLTPDSRNVAVAHHLNLEPDQLFSGPPGRAYLATHNTTTLLQLAMP